MESVFRGVTVYLFLLLIMRLSGRRTFSQMTPFDFVLVLIIAETTQQALLGDDYSIINALLLIVTLCSLDIFLSYLKRASPAIGKWLDGTPTLLVANGDPQQRALKKTRVEVNDILESARENQGLEKLEDIKYAVLEIDGKISIVPSKA